MDLMRELDNAKKEIFRFESLQEYFSNGKDKIQNKLERQWSKSREIDMDLMKGWHDFISKKYNQGVKFIWVKRVEFPLTEYTKMSLHIYKNRVKYGIDIRVISDHVFKKLKILLRDFYTLDNKIILMNYGKHNEFLDSEFSSDKKYKAFKSALIKNSIPVKDFDY